MHELSARNSTGDQNGRQQRRRGRAIRLHSSPVVALHLAPPPSPYWGSRVGEEGKGGHAGSPIHGMTEATAATIMLHCDYADACACVRRAAQKFGMVLAISLSPQASLTGEGSGPCR